MQRILTDLSDPKEGNEFILTLDYDSVMEPHCVTRLMASMLISGVDAIAPLQMKRDDRTLMFTPAGLANDDGPVTISLPAEWWESPAQPVDTAHFGCTLIRTAALRRTPKPWFHGVPNADGEWGDGRRDADIAFWHSFRAAGNSVAVCPQVAIGHAELVITWPDQRLKAIYQYPTHYWEAGGKRPPEAWGSEAHAEKSMRGGA
jgi:hypothetical protein